MKSKSNIDYMDQNQITRMKARSPMPLPNQIQPWSYRDGTDSTARNTLRSPRLSWGGNAMSTNRMNIRNSQKCGMHLYQRAQAYREKKNKLKEKIDAETYEKEMKEASFHP